MGQRQPRLAVLAASLALAACSFPMFDPSLAKDVSQLDPATFTCCADPERFYPERPMKKALQIASRGAGDLGAEAIYGRFERDGYPGRLVGNTAAVAAVMGQLKPFDMVFIANKSYLFGFLIPGYFSHDLMYIGTEAELVAAGLWSLPELRAHRDDIRAGKVFLEATAPVAQLKSPTKALEVDALAILRPELSAAEKRAALRRGLAAIGTPYDYGFDVDTPEALVCTELLDVAYPSLDFTVREAYGRHVIIPDDIVAQAIRGDKMRVIAYIVGDRHKRAGPGFSQRNIPSLMGDISAYWGAPKS